MIRRSTFAAVPVVALAMLTGCAASATPASTPADTGDGHGAISGAVEVAEAPLALLTVAADGAVGLVDLLDESVTSIGEVADAQALASDGRYGFVSTPEGIAVVDSGRWTWDHVDHFHYYEAEPRVVGTVEGAGDATVTTGMLSTAGATGIHFADSREALLVDNAALADGEIVELFRVPTDTAEALIAPLADGAVLADGDRLVHLDAEGEPTGASTPCIDAAGAITTRVGLVVGCADGAVLATSEDGAPVFETIPYPPDAAAVLAMSFDGRKGRPTVAARAGDAGFWLLDTRERTWSFTATSAPLARVSAVDDADGHVVAIDVEGRVRVFSGEVPTEVAVGDPLVDPATATLTLDESRAYVSDDTGAAVLEIDYADGGRVARRLDTPAGLVTEVGR